MYVNCIIMYSIKINGADYEDFAVINGYLHRIFRYILLSI